MTPHSVASRIFVVVEFNFVARIRRFEQMFEVNQVCLGIATFCFIKSSTILRILGFIAISPKLVVIFLPLGVLQAYPD